MNTSLNVRKSLVLTLAVLVIFLAAAMFLSGSQHPAAAVSQQVLNLIGVSPDSVTPALKIPVINPRVRFAPLGGRRIPAALDGRKPPPAALDGRRTPASLDGRKTPVTMLDGRKAPATTLDGRKVPAMMLDGRKLPPTALANPFTAQTAPLTLVDGLIFLALAAMLLVPARKAS